MSTDWIPKPQFATNWDLRLFSSSLMVFPGIPSRCKISVCQLMASECLECAWPCLMDGPTCYFRKLTSLVFCGRRLRLRGIKCTGQGHPAEGHKGTSVHVLVSGKVACLVHWCAHLSGGTRPHIRQFINIWQVSQWLKSLMTLSAVLFGPCWLKKNNVQLESCEI